MKLAREEIDAASLAILAQALDVILHGLLVGLQTITAERHFLDAAGFRIDQAQIAEGGRIQFFRRKDLDDVDLKSSTDQRGQAGFVTGRIEKIAKHDRHARLPGLQRATPQGFIETRRPAGGKRAEILEKLNRRFFAAHGAQRAARRNFAMAARLDPRPAAVGARSGKGMTLTRSNPESAT